MPSEAHTALGAYEPAEHVAELTARLGRVEEAIAWLEIASREHDTELNRLGADPAVRSASRGSPVTDLMRRVGFSPPAPTTASRP